MKEVAGADSGLKVVFPWGFRIVEFEGEKVLEPLSPDEYREAAAEDPGKPLTELELTARTRCRCKFTNTDTIYYGCTEAGGGWCSTHSSNGRWYRVCNYL